MIQFLGNIEAKADAKGRVFIPATFRKQLQAASEERLVLRKDVYQDCLVLYPESVWFATQNQLRHRLNKWNAKQQMIFRQFVSDAEVVTPDGNGRILLPKRYLQMAGIQSDVRFIGVDNTIEIWAKERADQPFMTPDEFGKALEELLGDGGARVILDAEGINLQHLAIEHLLRTADIADASQQFVKIIPLSGVFE